MGRPHRAAAGGYVYHVLNRANARMTIFEDQEGFAAFENVLSQAVERSHMRLLAYCLMPNHWHLVLWPKQAADLSRFFGWVCTTHVRRWRMHRHSNGEGHLYQGRFKSFPIQRDEHLLKVMAYVEANPLRAKLVERAQDWPFSSLWAGERPAESRVQLADGLLRRPADWLQRVNRSLSEDELERLRTSVNRGRPYGAERWTEAAAARLGLESSLRSPGRPRKAAWGGTKGE